MADPTANGTELRRHPRFLGIDGGRLRLAVRPEFRGRAAKVVDISVSGIGFLVKDPLEVGTVLVFDLQGDDGDGAKRIARVRHCRTHEVPVDAPWLPPAPVVSKFFRNLFGLETSRPQGEAWFVGCEFDSPISEDDMARLLAQLRQSI